MKGPSSPSIRLQLSVAFFAVAVFSVGLATLLSTQGLEPRLTDAADARIDQSTKRLATAASVRFHREGRWTRVYARELEHQGLRTGLRVAILRPDGRPVRTPDSAAGLDSTLGGPQVNDQPIVVDGVREGTLLAAPVGGSSLSPADIDLRASLEDLHVTAGVVAVAVAVLAALLLAQTISAPLRRIRSGAQRIERGDLDVRIEPAGGADVRAVGHALNRLAETLEHEEQVRKESVADLAHELRTPVSGLLSRIEAAQDGVLRDREANLAAMHTEASRLVRLLEDLGRLADAERPGLLLDKRAVDLAAVAGSEVEQMAASFAEKGVGLERELERAEIAGDPDRLAQIVTNLLANALRYTEPEGHVELRVAIEGDAAILDVADTGIGIDVEDLTHIFKRFWRADRSRSRATGGTGIGLAIVRELVIAHEGRIDVESAPGRGSRFRVWFPLVQATRLRNNGRSA